MFYAIISVLVALVYLTFFGLLLMLYIRTRSKGLMVIIIAYIGFAVIDAISKPIFDQYVESWSFGEINNWLTDRMSVGEFLITSVFIEKFFFYGLYSIGVFLIYKEWKQGKFNQPQPEHREASKL